MTRIWPDSVPHPDDVVDVVQGDTGHAESTAPFDVVTGGLQNSPDDPHASTPSQSSKIDVRDAERKPLSNAAASCYMNATLQFVFAILPVKNMLRTTFSELEGDTKQHLENVFSFAPLQCIS